ncbi:MAG: isocitrate lyase/phosphoenolpyruvate mutase family protein [Fimbriimonas sp.]|nr:isocitrate lyase/phosphoenolpyruvate mutase family protein [Fimbriimonas sp.]
MPEVAAKRAAFRALHESGCFVIPNPWDVGSARFLQSLGFKALATTSSGFAFTKGRPDSVLAMSRGEVLDHFAEMAGAADVPVNADFQSGYAANTTELAESVRLCIETGVSGFSIEDSTGDPDRPLFELAEAVERIVAARQTIDSSGKDVLLTARAECFLVGHSDSLAESIRRLQAYSDAGADVLFAPCPGKPELMRSIVEAVKPKPVNVIMSSHTGLTVADIAELGARRISVGSALSRTAWAGFLRAARMLASDGDFSGLEGASASAELNGFFAADYASR